MILQTLTRKAIRCFLKKPRERITKQCRTERRSQHNFTLMMLRTPVVSRTRFDIRSSYAGARVRRFDAAWSAVGRSCAKRRGRPVANGAVKRRTARAGHAGPSVDRASRGMSALRSGKPRLSLIARSASTARAPRAHPRRECAFAPRHLASGHPRSAQSRWRRPVHRRSTARGRSPSDQEIGRGNSSCSCANTNASARRMVPVRGAIAADPGKIRAN